MRTLEINGGRNAAGHRFTPEPRKELKLLLGWRLPVPLPYFLRLKQGHIVIFGRTGSGKSNTAMLIAYKASKRVPVLVLDWAGEYRLPGFTMYRPGYNLGINPVEFRGADLEEHIDFIVDLFGDTFSFTEPQRYMFRLAVRGAIEHGRASLPGVLQELECMPPQSRYDHETKIAIKRRLIQLVEGVAGRALSSANVDLDVLFGENVIVDLSVFRSVHTKKLFTLLLLKILYDYSVFNRGIQEGIAHLTIIEEAWNVIPYRRLDSEPSIGERLFAELRKYGECIVAVAQSPFDIAWSTAKNARVAIVHNVVPRDIDSIGLAARNNLSFKDFKSGDAYVIDEEGRTTRVKICKFKITTDKNNYLKPSFKLKEIDTSKLLPAYQGNDKETSLANRIVLLEERVEILEKAMVEALEDLETVKKYLPID